MVVIVVVYDGSVSNREARRVAVDQLTPGARVLVEVTVVVTDTVLVAVEVFVLVGPSKQEHALLILDVNGLPLPHPAPRTEGTFTVGAALFLRPGSAPRTT